MMPRQTLYAIVGYSGMVWSLAAVGSGRPFDALVMAILAVLVVYESYRKEQPNE